MHGTRQKPCLTSKKGMNMNLRSKISLAAFAAVTTVAALASAQGVQQCVLNQALDPQPLGSEAAPISCELNGVVANAFAINNGGQITLVVDMVGDGASFADSFGFDANGDDISDCHPIDTDPDAGPGQRDEDADGCNAAVEQDLAIEFNEG
jgi:hypothetical protein